MPWKNPTNLNYCFMTDVVIVTLCVTFMAYNQTIKNNYKFISTCVVTSIKIISLQSLLN